MATNPDRASYFPAIEKKYGQPMSYWFDRMAEVKGRTYDDQMAFLQEGYGFSRAHANALVLYSRGNTTSKRFNTFEDYLKPLDATKRKTMRAIYDAIRAKFPKAEIVIAWNQPMVKIDGRYVFGASAQKAHILIAPFNADVIDDFRARLVDYQVNKKTIRVPVDWKVDKKLITDLVAASAKAGQA
ncbi:MAG: DUF4287 domain-containing protein [Actinomycetota bacterium]